MTDSLEARREHEPYDPNEGVPDVEIINSAEVRLRRKEVEESFARGVESRPPVDVEAALDEWLADEDCWPEHDEFGVLTGAVASDREGLLNLLRTVTTPSEPLTLEQLEALPVGSVVLDDRELSWQTDESGMWTRLDWRCTSGDMLITFGPVRLLHTGTVTKED